MRVRVTRVQPQAQPPDIDNCTDRLIVVRDTTAEHPPLTDLPPALVQQRGSIRKL